MIFNFQIHSRTLFSIIISKVSHRVDKKNKNEDPFGILASMMT
jgi:hypothetical protein